VASDGREFADSIGLLWAIDARRTWRPLELKSAGVALDGGLRGHGRLSEHQCAGVYAIGDVTGRAALTPVAIAPEDGSAIGFFGGMTDRRIDTRTSPRWCSRHPPSAHRMSEARLAPCMATR